VQIIQHKGCAANPLGGLASIDASKRNLSIVLIKGSGKAPQPEVSLERQEQAHAHSILFDPSRHYALSADLGMDRVWIYRFEGGNLQLNLPSLGKIVGDQGTKLNEIKLEEEGWDIPQSDALAISEKNARCNHSMAGHNLKPGAGPRHIVFHPNGHFFYVSNELDSTVTVFTWNDEVGCLSPLQVCPTIPEEYSGVNYPAHVTFTPDGHFLYVSNRGSNSLAAFSVDGATGRLISAGHYPSRGEWPRHFCIGPDGKYLYVANQESGSINIFAIDPFTGALIPTGDILAVPKPYFVTVVEFP